MKSVNVHNAKTHLSALLLAVETRGECFIISRAGKPVAELRPVQRIVHRLAPHAVASQIAWLEDPTAPLSAEEWGTLR